MIFIDPDGMKFTGDTTMVNNLKSSANASIKSENKKQARLKKRISKRTAKGKKTSRLSRRLAASEKRVGNLTDMLSEISILDASSTEFFINSDYSSSSNDGQISWDASNNRFNIDVESSYGLPGLGHELKHAFQFESGDIDFFSDGGPGLLYDIYDEVDAFNRQFAIKARSMNATPKSVSSLLPIYNQIPRLRLNTKSGLGVIDRAWQTQGHNFNLTTGKPLLFMMRYKKAGYPNLLSK